MTKSDLISRQDAIETAIEAVDDWDGGTNPTRANMITDAINNIVTSAEPEWIPCRERLPDNHDSMLVTGIEAISNTRVYKVMCWDVDRWRPANYAPSITWDAWMPLPEPYQPKEDA